MQNSTYVLSDKHRAALTDLCKGYLKNNHLLPPNMQLKIVLEVVPMPLVEVSVKQEAPGELDCKTTDRIFKVEIESSKREGRMSPELYSFFKRCLITTVGHVACVTEHEWTAIWLADSEKLQDIKKFLGQYGLTMGMSVKAKVV